MDVSELQKIGFFSGVYINTEGDMPNYLLRAFGFLCLGSRSKEGGVGLPVVPRNGEHWRRFAGFDGFAGS